jgi:hypothetical protein
VAGLRQLRPIAQTRRIDLVAPSIGVFDGKTLVQWANRAGTSVDRLALAWIPKGHRWGKQGWSMPRETAAALRDTDVTVKAFPDPDDGAIEAFHDDWDRTGDRWVHGKLYWIQDAHRHRLLVTSANWSQAAWGKPLPNSGLLIENFELGVAFDSGWSPLGSAALLDDDLEAGQPVPRDPEATISWSEGMWNGKAIRLAARLSSPKARLLSAVEVVWRLNSIEKTVRWLHEGAQRFRATFSWPPAQGVPTSVVLRTSGRHSEKVEVTVSDMRPRCADAAEEFEGIDAKEAEKLELRLLEERYGGPSADDPADPVATQGDGSDSDITLGGGQKEWSIDSGKDEEPDAPAPTVSYEVPAVANAREKLAIVTKWAETLEAISDEDQDGALAIVEDGRRLLRLWRSQENADQDQAGLAARVAIGELVARLKRCQ